MWNKKPEKKKRNQFDFFVVLLDKVHYNNNYYNFYCMGGCLSATTTLNVSSETVVMDNCTKTLYV